MCDAGVIESVKGGMMHHLDPFLTDARTMATL